MSKNPIRPRISFEQLRGNCSLDRLQAPLERPVWLEPAGQLADRQCARFDQRLVADSDGTGLGVEALAVASRTANDAHVLLKLEPARPGGRLLEAAQELRDQPFPLAAVLPDGSPAHLPFVSDVPVAGSVEKNILVFDRQLLPRRLQVDAERLGHALENVSSPPAHAAHPAHQRDRSVEKAQRRVGNEQLPIEREAVAETIAVGAHSLRTVEAE